jgi:hypothetical protein
VQEPSRSWPSPRPSSRSTTPTRTRAIDDPRGMLLRRRGLAGHPHVRRRASSSCSWRLFAAAFADRRGGGCRCRSWSRSARLWLLVVAAVALVLERPRKLRSPFPFDHGVDHRSALARPGCRHHRPRVAAQIVDACGEIVAPACLSAPDRSLDRMVALQPAFAGSRPQCRHGWQSRRRAAFDRRVVVVPPGPTCGSRPSARSAPDLGTRSPVALLAIVLRRRSPRRVTLGVPSLPPRAAGGDSRCSPASSSS